MLQIRWARKEEYTRVRDFYYELIDLLEDAAYKPGWQKGIYPADEYLLESLRRGELVVGESEGKVLAAMIVNHGTNDGYAGTQWQVEAEPEEVTVIHALGVMPTQCGKGLGGKMVRWVIDHAKDSGQRALRLDVLAGNEAALRLYTREGFRYIRTVQMFYENTGWADFLLYEYVI